MSKRNPAIQIWLEPCYRMLGSRIEMIRETLGMTQLELAHKCEGLTRTSIANLEAGRQRIPLHKVELIALALHTTPKHLMRGIWT